MPNPTGIVMDSSPRIVSLLPAATEIVAALGLTRALVGRSHECDEPAEVATLPALTSPRIDASASSRRIHDQVERALGDGRTGSTALYDLDAERLAALEPDLILTQAACDVCAIAADDVRAAVRRMDAPARVLELSPATLADVFADILTVGMAAGTPARAREVVARLRARVASVACRVRAASRQAAAGVHHRMARPADGGRQLGARARGPRRRPRSARHAGSPLALDPLGRRDRRRSRRRRARAVRIHARPHRRGG
ncbi:MAG: hypothetical protein EBS56_01705 [Planctomycetia bacterium]|nr:hypothetical protein [Planctomycetia bacterium]